MDRLVGYELDDRREMREYGIDGRGELTSLRDNGRWLGAGAFRLGLAKPGSLSVRALLGNVYEYCNSILRFSKV